MYQVQNEKPPFLPYDICRIVGTKDILIITEVCLNTSQSEDLHQWSFSGTPLGKSNKCAWYDQTELSYLGNVFEIIMKESRHPFGGEDFNVFFLSNYRR